MLPRPHATKYLVKRDDIYYFRMAIPTGLRRRFGCGEVKTSLHTDNKMLARLRCRYLANRFEELFMVVAAVPELTQTQLQEIARAYFRELLVAGNNRIYWIEDMFGNSPEDRAEAIDGAEQRETRLRELHAEGAATPLFSKTVAKKLAEQGIKGVTASSDSYGILSDYFVRAEIESSRVLRAKLKKDYQAIAPIDSLYTGIMDDTLPPITGHGLGAPVAVKSVGELVKKFHNARKGAWEYKTRMEYERVLRWFVEWFGENKPVTTLSNTDIGEFRDALLKIPKNYTKPKGNSGLTLKEAMQQMAGSPVLASRTAEKYLILARAFLNWCEDEGHIEKVPGKKIRIDYKMQEKPRLPFTNEQLKALFCSPMWTGCRSHARRARTGSMIERDAYYWIPLLAAYTGMRCGEIVQLRHMDISTFADIPYIDINDDNQKKLKTKYSRRRIPIHPRLKEWGFMEFLAKRNTGTPDKRIFDEIDISTEGDVSNAYSKKFANYMKAIGIKNNKLTFHSFRHMFSDAVDNASVVEAHKKAMMGHSDKSASAQYGVGSSVPVLLEAISKISYDFEKVFVSASASPKPQKGAAA